MFSLIYRSIAVESIELSEILSINKESIAFNKKHGITGCFLHHQGRFVQILEGNRKIVLSLFEKIKIDKRHYDVKVLYTEDSVIRIFNNWSMIFDDVHKNSVEKMKCFERIYHSSDAAFVPSVSKLYFWKEVAEILKEERQGMMEA